MAVLSRRSSLAATRQANRDAILAATVALLDEGAPFAEISIEQIVKRAGLSRPTFYAYFTDKRGLILQLGETLQAEVAAVADPWLRTGEGEVRETLAAVLGTFGKGRGILAALVEAASYDSEVNAFWHAFHERFRETAALRIRAADPALPSARADARAFTLVWMTERTMTEFLAGSDVEEAALLDELARFWDLGS